MSPAFWPFGRHQFHIDAHIDTHNTIISGDRVFAAAPPPPPPPPSPPPPPAAHHSSQSRQSRHFDTSVTGDTASGVAGPSALAAAKIDPDFGLSTAPEHRPLDGCADFPSSTTQSRLLKAASQQPAYPIASWDSSTAEPSATSVAAGNGEPQPAALRHHNTAVTPSPFRKGNRKNQSAVSSYVGARPSSSRLWNPTNSTPRDSTPRNTKQKPKQKQQNRRKRRPSTPPTPTVPLRHPGLWTWTETNDALAVAAGSYPLLTPTEQRQSRHAAASTRTSLCLEQTGISHRRISLPPSVRISTDGQHSLRPRSIALDVAKTIPGSHSCVDATNRPGPSAESKGKQRERESAAMATTTEDMGASYSRNLERGPEVMDPRMMTSASAADGIGPSLSSSNSSIMGEDVPPDAGEEWGPQHPCYPHLNPHVPLDSVEFATTRIIRVKRDWLVAGDLAPTFSNLYPEILDPAGVSEQEFRRVVDKLNGELISIFDPFGFRNMLDTVLGLITGWVWDDVGLTAAKSRLSNLEKWMERWNLEMEKTMSSEEGVMPPKLIPLRQTGYMNLDIQIPDPEIAPAPSTIGAGESRTTLPLEPTPAHTAGSS
ncbi:hypothetical protein E4U41_002628 [Claviceps citrina]|nr:hypothetical protein E4U41_002628 [Claviceps citrina]